MDRLIAKVEAFGSPRVLVVGDFFLDSYIYGDAERISPEAPVPVLRVVRREHRVGGAGNVAIAVAALGGQVDCLGVTGCDEAGGELRRLLGEHGVQTSALLEVDGRCTGLKTRYVGLAQHRHPQQILRVDEEVTAGLTPEAQDRLLEAMGRRLDAYDIVALEDYDKGLLENGFAARVTQLARSAGKQVLVDPALLGDYARYRGCTLLTPNRYEASRASGISIVDRASLEAAAGRILEVTQAQGVAITLDKEGMFVLTDAGEGEWVLPAQERSVYDVTGAGDEVLAMMLMSAASGCDWSEAAALSNVAGGLEVERFGVVPITRDEVLVELHRLAGQRATKVLPRGLLAAELDRRRRTGQTVVFTNGCFDLLHMGHVRYLQEARELGACLVVAINSDPSVQRLKGSSRPVIGAVERAAMLGALECVDYVTIFDEDTPCELLELLRPDVLVKGGTTPVVVGREIVEGYGGKVVTTGAVAGLSTTQIIGRIVGTADAPGGN